MTTKDYSKTEAREQQLLDAALLYADAGIPVLSIYGIRRPGVCACGSTDCKKSKGKHPHWANLPGDVNLDPAAVRAVRKQAPGSNVAIRPGFPLRDWPQDKLVVIDLDGPLALAWWEAMQAEHGPAPETYTVKSGRSDGGQHLYFRAPLNMAIPTRKGTVAPKVDVFCDTGYVLAPPSRHETGDYYTVSRDAEIAPGPLWLLDMLSGPSEAMRGVERQEHPPIEPQARRRDVTLPDGTDRESLKEAIFQTFMPEGEGERNTISYKWAAQMRNNGFSYAETADLAPDYHAEVYVHDPEPGHDWTIDELHTNIDYAFRCVEPLNRILALAREQAWRGNRFQVLEQIVKTCLSAGKMECVLPLRTLAARSMTSEPATRENVKWLIENGWLKKDIRSGTTRYEVRLPFDHESFPSTLHIYTNTTYSSVEGLHTSSKHDAFRTGAIGNCRPILQVLSDEPKTPAQIGREIGKDRSTVQRSLTQKLSPFGLAAKEEGGWIASFDDMEEKLDKVATHFGTACLSEVTEQRHNRERADYRKRMEEYASGGQSSFAQKIGYQKTR